MKREKERRIWIISILMLLIVFIIGLIIYKNLLITTNPLNGYLRIIDGDTFEMYPDGPIVRLLCVDTPEEGEEGYEEAKIFLGDLLYNHPFFMNHSRYSDWNNNTDAYGRLLMWVYLEDEELGKQVLANKLIINEGYGELMIIPPETCEEITEIIVD
jgi:endonuclease YncB( thermonuclease family)